MARGIEVFGRNATIVDYGVAGRLARTPAAGAGALLVAIAAVAALVAAIIERSDLFTWIALGASSIAVVVGLFALLTGRGRLLGFVAAVLGALSNPWLLTQLLQWAASLG